jgi:hypothetical protein
MRNISDRKRSEHIFPSGSITFVVQISNFGEIITFAILENIHQFHNFDHIGVWFSLKVAHLPDE